MKRIVPLFVLFVVFVIVLSIAYAQGGPASPQDTPSIVTPIKIEAPKLTAEQRDRIRAIQVQIEAVQIQQYRNRDAYNDAQKRLDEQSQELGKQYEVAIAEVSKGVDAKKFVFNRGTLEFAPAEEPKK